jgi:hypothetical protein
LKKNRRVVIFFSLAVITILIYTIAVVQDRNNLGQLETFDYDPTLKYCNYIIEDGQPDAGYLNPDDKICVVCDESYPKVKNVCHSRIRFISATGLVNYNAKIEKKSGKICTVCTTARQYYKKPQVGSWQGIQVLIK